MWAALLGTGNSIMVTKKQADRVFKDIAKKKRYPLVNGT